MYLPQLKVENNGHEDKQRTLCTYCRRSKKSNSLFHFSIHIISMSLPLRSSYRPWGWYILENHFLKAHRTCNAHYRRGVNIASLLSSPTIDSERKRKPKQSSERKATTRPWERSLWTASSGSMPHSLSISHISCSDRSGSISFNLRTIFFSSLSLPMSLPLSGRYTETSLSLPTLTLSLPHWGYAATQGALSIKGSPSSSPAKFNYLTFFWCVKDTGCEGAFYNSSLDVGEIEEVERRLRYTWRIWGRICLGG